jgi:DNA-binding XRE family transcriptional regulator
MSKTLEQKLAELPEERQRRVVARSTTLLAEERALQELRKAHRMTQSTIAKKLGIGQEGVSRLEQRSDLLLSTLRGYVEAMGGKLSLVAEFPGRAPVVLTGLANVGTTSDEDR